MRSVGLRFAPTVHGAGDTGFMATLVDVVPAASVAPEDAAEHSGWIGAFFGLDIPASSTTTRGVCHWTASHPPLVEDLDAGHCFRSA